MKERTYFKKNDLIEMLEKVSRSLERPVHGVLIGGMAMMYHGAKESTKDIDIVFNREDDIIHFIQTIEDMGFKKNIDLTNDYLDLKAHAIYFSDNGHMLDLFLCRVLDGFYLTDDMVERSKQIHINGYLSLSVLSPVDIFLFKSITMREGDLLDMAFLAPMIDDWEPFKKELEFLKYDYRLVSRSYERLNDLYDEHQIEVPIYSWMQDMGEMATAKTVILSAIQYEPKDKDFLFEGLDSAEKHLLEMAIRELHNDGIILELEGTISLK